MNITKMRGWGFYKPGRRAVGSRSRWGLHNERAISRYIPHEIDMSADERKDTILPCGYTIAQSWAALRKSWLGFNISHCNGDWSGMSKYAYQIRKLQLQMGIQLTHFDPAILDVPVDDEDEYEEEVQEGANDIRNEKLNTQDYDKIMEEARINLKGEQASRVGPRDQIFTKAAKIRRTIFVKDKITRDIREQESHVHAFTDPNDKSKQDSRTVLLLQRMRKSNEKRKIRLNHAPTKGKNLEICWS